MSKPSKTRVPWRKLHPEVQSYLLACYEKNRAVYGGVYASDTTGWRWPGYVLVACLPFTMGMALHAESGWWWLGALGFGLAGAILIAGITLALAGRRPDRPGLFQVADYRAHYEVSPLSATITLLARPVGATLTHEYVNGVYQGGRLRVETAAGKFQFVVANQQRSEQMAAFLERLPPEDQSPGLPLPFPDGRRPASVPWMLSFVGLTAALTAIAALVIRGLP